LILKKSNIKYIFEMEGIFHSLKNHFLMVGDIVPQNFWFKKRFASGIRDEEGKDMSRSHRRGSSRLPHVLVANFSPFTSFPLLLR
jgi:hypothetical protein